MPELPEVESVRRGLESLIGARITRATLHRRDMLCVPGDPPGGWERSRSTARPKRVTRAMLLAETTITQVRRHGKELAILADTGATLAGHLGMTGQFLILKPNARAPRDHVHATWRFEDGRRLVFRDPRRFGGLWAFPTPDALHTARWARLGPDALAITADALAERLAHRSRGIKACLLDQQIIAGVGNIYADEALFETRIHPETPADRLTTDQHHALTASIHGILTQAIHSGGSTLRDYAQPDGSAGTYRTAHRVYGRSGQPCPRCQSPIQTSTVAQRTTHHCPICQT